MPKLYTTNIVKLQLVKSFQKLYAKIIYHQYRKTAVSKKFPKIIYGARTDPRAPEQTQKIYLHIYFFTFTKKCLTNQKMFDQPKNV